MASTQEKATLAATSRSASAASETEWTAGTVTEVSDLSSTRSAANLKNDRPSLQNPPAVKGIFNNLLLRVYMQM